jgi:hypothetical protein
MPQLGKDVVHDPLGRCRIYEDGIRLGVERSPVAPFQLQEGAGVILANPLDERSI